MLETLEIAAALDAVVGGASTTSAPRSTTPRQKSRRSGDVKPEATDDSTPSLLAPRAPRSRRKAAKPQAVVQSATNTYTPAAPVPETPEAINKATTRHGQPPETPSATGGADEGQIRIDGQSIIALVGEIVEVQGRYNDLRRARQRILLQGMAVCRRACGGDKVAGAKLYAEPTAQVAAWLLPYHAAMAPLDEAINREEKALELLGKSTPVAPFAAEVSGLSYRFLAMIVGECGIGPGEYRTPSALWKRMGMAVINGERQRRVTGAAAIEQGYVARRRSLMWNIGGSILKAQIRNLRDEAGKKVDGSAYAIGGYGALYLEHKARIAELNERGAYAPTAAKIAERAKKAGEKPHPTNVAGKLTPAHIHNRAQRYIEKRLLRELWRAWRRSNLDTTPMVGPTASDASEHREDLAA